MADYKTDRYEVTKLTKSIIKIHSLETSGLSLKDAKEVAKLIDELANGNKFAILRTTSNNFFSTDRVRSLVASKQFAKYRYAMAFVVHSSANKISAEFYIQFHKPVSLTKIFNDEKKALEWLKEQEEIQYGKD